MTAALRGRRGADPDDDLDDAAPPRRSPVRLVLLVVAVLATVAAAVVWLSPVLGLRTVTVQGSGAAALAPQVREAVGVPMGTPLIRIDLAAVRDRVAAVGPVASASVARTWPHTLVITVTERHAVAVTQADGHWWLLDATGLPYQRVDAPPAGLMPVQLATPGKGDRATLAALGVLAALPDLPASVRSQVRDIVAPNDYHISLVLSGGRTVIWGGDVDNRTKALVLPALLRRPGTVFDITDPTLATVR